MVIVKFTFYFSFLIVVEWGDDVKAVSEDEAVVLVNGWTGQSWRSSPTLGIPRFYDNTRQNPTWLTTCYQVSAVVGVTRGVLLPGKDV